MLVTLTRAAWLDLIAQAAGHVREGGGLLIGTRTRYGNILVAHVPGLTHAEADDETIRYGPDEIAMAREAAGEVFKPMEPLGGWHSHPWSERCSEATANQITDDWDDDVSDVSEMLDNEVELIVSIYPHNGKRLANTEQRLSAVVAGRVARVEGWLRVRRGKLELCTLRVRG